MMVVWSKVDKVMVGTLERRLGGKSIQPGDFCMYRSKDKEVFDMILRYLVWSFFFFPEINHTGGQIWEKAVLVMLKRRCPCWAGSWILGPGPERTYIIKGDHRGHMLCVCLDLKGHTAMLSGPQDTQVCVAGYQKLSKWTLLVCREVVPEAIVGVWNRNCQLQCL